MSVSISIAIWAVVAILATVAVFMSRFLHQLTKMGYEGEGVLKTLNSRLPPLLDRGEEVLVKADNTVDRVNATLDEIDVPIRYARSIMDSIFESKQFLKSKFGQSAMSLAAGFKASKSIMSSLKQIIFSTKHEDVPGEEG